MTATFTSLVEYFTPFVIATVVGHSLYMAKSANVERNVTMNKDALVGFKKGYVINVKHISMISITIRSIYLIL